MWHTKKSTNICSPWIECEQNQGKCCKYFQPNNDGLQECTKEWWNVEGALQSAFQFCCKNWIYPLLLQLNWITQFLSYIKQLWKVEKKAFYTKSQLPMRSRGKQILPFQNTFHLFFQFRKQIKPGINLANHSLIGSDFSSPEVYSD